MSTQYVEEYLQDMSRMWSNGTVRSERSRLLSFLQRSIHNGMGTNLRPYSLKTAYIRAEHYARWVATHRDANLGGELLKQLADTRPNFKGAYERKFPTATFEEARSRIETIPDRQVREVCLGILLGGYRISEVAHREGGNIRGKVSKLRPDFGGYARTSSDVSEKRIRRALRLIGLKPHDLRKLFATQLYRKGLREADICRVMGWASFATARSYIIPQDDKRLEAIVKGLR